MPVTEPAATPDATVAAWWVGSLPWALAVVAVLTLVVAGARLPWFKLRGDPAAQRVLVWTTAILAAMRWFNADALAGSSLHFLGAAIASLMFGPGFALWALAVASLLAWVGETAWLGWGPDFLACGVVPVLVARALFRFEQARLPPNLFVYVLVNGGMISGLLPVVGVPMPLLSYGGTAPVALLLGFGVVMALKARRTVHR